MKCAILRLITANETESKIYVLIRCINVFLIFKIKTSNKKMQTNLLGIEVLPKRKLAYGLCCEMACQTMIGGLSFLDACNFR